MLNSNVLKTNVMKTNNICMLSASLPIEHPSRGTSRNVDTHYSDRSTEGNTCNSLDPTSDER